MSFVARSDAVNPLLRTASSEGAVQLQHPTPDLQSLQGAYVQNVERLEEHAERMSSTSSDIGEEIRKLRREQKLSDSRRSSMLSNAIQEEEIVTHSRSRNVSTSSYANSIVDLNNSARHGGYSPGGYMTSPKGSLRSGSWSQVSFTASIPRQRSISKGSRLGQVSSLDDEGELVQSPVEDPTLVGIVPRLDGLRITTNESFSNMFEQSAEKRNSQEEHGGTRLPSDGSFTHLYNSMVDANSSAPHLAAPRTPSDTSFTDVYNQIATEIREQLYDAGAGGKSPAMNSSIQPTPVEEQKPFVTREQLLETVANDHHRFQLLSPQVPLIDDVEMAKRLSGLEPLDEESDPPPRSVLQIHRTGSMDGRPIQNVMELPDRPITAASTDTYQQAQTLFRDFDGAYYAPSIRDAIRESSGGLDRRASAMLTSPPNVDPRVPPPAPGMIFYPAPVPRQLNLPQRLSQMPSAAVQARRRTQMLSELPPEVRKSMPWLGQEQGRSVTEGATLDPRQSKMTLSNMPPHLRASMFFETPGSSQEVEMVDDSAVATLDDLLDASANAPASAFINHPFVGRLGADVYRKEELVKSASSPSFLPKPEKAEKKNRRSSMLGLRRNSISSTDQLREENNKTPNKLQKRNSRSNSLAALDDSALARGPGGEIAGIGKSAESAPERERERDGREADDEQPDHEEEEEEGDDEPEYKGPPTTLLAELQARKAQQKQRNRTAATAFPNGMHATLLEMDAVAQLQKTKRKKTRVTLAWEDPETHAAADAADKDDEDVPLGMLFPGKNKRDPGDWNRPLGLLEKKELEDNEPLSRRRNRLLGIDMARRTPSPGKSMPEVQVTGDNDEDSGHEGETLAERIRRLKNQKELDEALGDVATRPVSTAFSTEMLSEFGIGDEKAQEKRESTGSQAVKSVSSGEKSPNRSGANTPGEEETLGQRRARLQREALGQARRASRVSLAAEARLGDNLTAADGANRASTMLQTPATTPPLRTSRSMADLLQSFPAGKFEARKISNEALTSALPPGSLLARNEQKQAVQKARMNDHRQRASSYGFDATLVDIGTAAGPTADQRKSGGFMNGLYNGGGLHTAADQPVMMGVQEQQQAMMYGHQYQNGFYPSPAGMQTYPYANPAFAQGGYAMGMGTPLGYPANMMYAQQPQQQQQHYHSSGLGLGVNGHTTMTNPHLLLSNVGGGLGQRSMANLNEGTYHPHQSFRGQSTMPNLHGGMYEVRLDQKERERIDAWRLGVMQ